MMQPLAVPRLTRQVAPLLMITVRLVAFVPVGADHIHIQLRLCSFGCRRWCGHTTLGRVAAYSAAGAVPVRRRKIRFDDSWSRTVSPLLPDCWLIRCTPSPYNGAQVGRVCDMVFPRWFSPFQRICSPILCAPGQRSAAHATSSNGALGT